MPVVAMVAVAAATAYSANRQSKAAKDAAGQQAAAAEAGMGQQQAQFQQIQQMLAPYVQAGQPALNAQQNLLGLNGNQAQASAIGQIQNSPQFQALLKQGENSILQNASATGGLRGGNTQAALAQFSPAMLSAAINDQYTRLGGMTTLGQNAAAGVGNAGMQTANSVAQLLQQQGAAMAGGALASGRAQAAGANAISQGIGMYGSMGGFQQQPAAPAAVGNAGYGNYKAFYDNGGGM